MHQLKNIFSVNSAPSSLRVQDWWPALVSFVTWAKKCLQRIQRVLRILIEQRMFSTVQPAPQAIELHHAQTFSIWIKFCSTSAPNSLQALSFKLAPSSSEFRHSVASSGEAYRKDPKRAPNSDWHPASNSDEIYEFEFTAILHFQRFHSD